MEWKTPQTEEAWEEYLSAYLDGEMSLDDITELEKILKTNPKREAQLEEMRNTSSLLKKWKIDAPEPDATFIREVRKQAEPKQKSILRLWFKSLKMQVVLPSFLVGIFAGILLMTFVNQDNSPAIVNTDKSVYLADQYTISKRQADQLLSELDAEKLKVNILGEINKRNITTALKMLKELESKYPESQALKDLNENRKLNYLQKRIQLASLNS